ncbi:MAG: serine hydrolase [Bacteroidota bacterium]
MNFKIKLIIILFFYTTMHYGQNAYTYSQPISLNDGWKTNHLKSQNIDSTLFYKLFDQILNGENKLHSVLLVKNNELLLEEYFNGYKIDQPHDLRSCTKSLRSLLLGIAIDKGFIDSIDDPMNKYLTNLSPRKNLDDRKADITIKHLITMSTGLDCNDWDKKSKGQEDKVYKKKDWLQYTVDLPMINDPGEVAFYCSMGVILMTEVIQESSGMSIDQFAEQFLFLPLGITNLKWGHTTRKAIITSGKRLYMTSRDMAKIGQLILNKGEWNGQRIISKAWIKEATTPKVKISGTDYGYLWWNFQLNNKGKATISKTATGNGGQYIMVLPEHNLVAVFTGGAYNSQEDKLPFAIMNNVVLPSIKN